MEYPLEPQGGIRILNVDPAFGESESASKFDIVGFERRPDDKKFYVVHAEQRARPSPEVMTDYISQVYHSGKYTICQVDSAFPGLVSDLAAGSTKTNRKPINVVKLSFAERLETMTVNAPMKIQNDEVRIHPAFSDLISQLKSVEYNEKGRPDKKNLKFDMGDTFLMGLDYWSTTFAGRKLKGEF